MNGGSPNVAASAQYPAHIPLRVAVLQFKPKIGQVDANIAKARELCLKLQPHSIDLLCFPEMAFTGYVFDSAEAISPYLEEPRTGPSSLFCQEIAIHLGCYVVGGYPESLREEERAALESEPEPPVDGVKKDALAGGMEILPVDGSLDVPQQLSSNQSTTVPSKPEPRIQVGANSAVIFGPSGQWVGGYRKTNLFQTDVTWAKPGTGFTSFSLPLIARSQSSGSAEDAAAPHLKVALAICMDLNPHPPALWTSAEGPFELADYCAEKQSKLLVLLNAWLYSGLTEDGELANDGKGTEGQEDRADEEPEEKVDDDEPDWYTLRYWTARLEPLWRRDGRRRGSHETVVSESTNGSEGTQPEAVAEVVEEEEEEEKPPHETIVVVCNRTGNENGKTFAGSSAIFSMRAGSGRPKLLDMMGMQEEGVRVWNLLV